MKTIHFAGPRPDGAPSDPVIPQGSSRIAADLALLLPEAAIVRVIASGARSHWSARAYDGRGQRLKLTGDPRWAEVVVDANPQADWSEGLDLDLATGGLLPSGASRLGAAA